MSERWASGAAALQEPALGAVPGPSEPSGRAHPCCGTAMGTFLLLLPFGGCFSIVHRAATLLLAGLTFHLKSFFWFNSNFLRLNKIGAACQEGRVIPCRVATQREESELNESKQFNGPWRIPSTSKGRNQEFTVSRSDLSHTAVNVVLWLQRTHEFYTTQVLPISHHFPAVLSVWFMLCASAFTTNALLPFIMCLFVCHVISYNPSKTLQ